MKRYLYILILCAGATLLLGQAVTIIDPAFLGHLRRPPTTVVSPGVGDNMLAETGVNILSESGLDVYLESYTPPAELEAYTEDGQQLLTEDDLTIILD